MNLERKGTKSAKDEFSALSASLRFYGYHLILPPLYAICPSSRSSGELADLGVRNQHLVVNAINGDRPAIIFVYG
jgi:hypothetical protein